MAPKLVDPHSSPEDVESLCPISIFVLKASLALRIIDVRASLIFSIVFATHRILEYLKIGLHRAVGG